MLKIKVEGYVEAKKILDELPNNMQKRMLLTALRGSAKPMLKSAQSKVPIKSGKLKKQLRIVRYKDRQASRTEVAVAVKPVFEKTKKKGAVKGVKPTPFLEQAYSDSGGRAVDIFGDELASAVEKFVSKNFKPIIK